MINNSITSEIVTEVLSRQLGKTVLSVDYQITQLHGGTLGDVRLLAGTCKTAENVEEPFQLVCKIQKQWQRPGDPDSWRREYDLYTSDFDSVFSDTFRWPKCYYAEIKGDETQIWMEYINGISGTDLTEDMLEKVAIELGRFQGKLYKKQDMLHSIPCLVDTGFMQREHNQWHTQTFTYEFLCSEQCRMPEHIKEWVRDSPWDKEKSLEYNYLRSADYDIPEHLKQMLIDVDDNREMIFQNMKRLPVVLCHRDVWIENVFVSDEEIVLIDWDCAGFGYMGEDIASLIYDDIESENLQQYFHRLIPAYYKGISEYMDVPSISYEVIWEMIILKFGYRIIQEYMFTTSDDVKRESVNRLQKIYEIRDRGTGLLTQ